MDTPAEKVEKPQKQFVQPCGYTDLTRSTANTVVCGATGKMFPAGHCGPKCEAYRPHKGNA